MAPGRSAILAPDHPPLTYGALWSRVEAAVRGLRGLGIGGGDRVAVVLPNGPESAVAMVAVATAAVCVPLNPGFTADECHRYFADLRITALLTRRDMCSAGRGAAHALGIPVIDLLPQPGDGRAVSLLGSQTRGAVDDEPARRPEDDAFILLTSGTTSRPKMVPLTHASVCLSAHNAGTILALQPRDRLLNVLPLFHAHGLISGLLAALAAGSSVVCAPSFAPDAFFAWLRAFRPTWYTAVPSIHRALLSAAACSRRSAGRCSLRIIRSASASLPHGVLGELECLFGVPVIETYGMTEAASQIAANPMHRRKLGSVGRPAGAEIAIIDSVGRHLAVGQRGEIALRGPTITRGYDNDSAATRSAFQDGWFLTGDLGYLDADGYLFIVGRIKDVIKRGGQQVAPAEVEEALLSHPDVVEAAAFSVPHRRLGEDVAAAVVLRPHASIGAEELRKFAGERLARFKVPGPIRIVPEIPKSPAGKIQREALGAALSLTGPAPGGCEGTLSRPRTDLERRIAKIWAQLLERDEISLEADVFALGADSLMVTQMLSRLRQRLGADLSFRDIFDAPTVAGLAARLDAAASDAAARPSLRHGKAHARGFRLSFQQQRIYVLSGLDPTRHHYHVVEVARLFGPLDVGALEASIAAIGARHETLRSTFHEQSGEPVQRVGTAGPRLERLDLGGCPRPRRAAAIRRHARRVLHRPFELEKEPPLRAELMRLDADDHALAIKLHHLVTDGWSQRLFWQELEALYGAHVSGVPAGLAELPIQYRDFVAWQEAWLRTPAAEQQLAYWRRQLKGMTDLPLRTDRPRPHAWTGRGARHPFALSPSVAAGLRSLSQTHSVTLFMTLLAAFQCLLYRHTEHEDIAVGTLIANRNQIEIEPLIGMFANTIVLRTDLSGDPTFCEVLRRVRQVTLDAYRNQDLPIEKILQVMQVPRSLRRNPLFQVMFLLQNPSPRTRALADLSVERVEVDPRMARFDLMLELVDAGERLSGWFEYSSDLFEADTIARMAMQLRTLFGAVVANPEERLSRLAVLAGRERRRLLGDGEKRASFGRPATFYQRFAEQVERAPRAPAVSSRHLRLTYRELERRSTAIAHRLALAGVGRDRVVVLLAPRDIDLLAGMIAVQRAGGAFLALDPALPAARLVHLIRCSGSALVLGGSDSTAALEQAWSGVAVQEHPRILRLDDLRRTAPRYRTPPARPAPSSLAYLVYTSGSTGVPKGAMIEQRGLLNHLLWQISELRLSAADVVAQTAPQSFVISVWQFLAALMVGARVHVCGDAVVRDPTLLLGEIEREGVTILQIVPPLLRAILDQNEEAAFRALSRLRFLISTGEPLPPDLCRAWFRRVPDVPLINAYGSAECSDDVATHVLTVPPPAHTAVSLGRAIANTRLYVLDRHLQPVPIGVAGELYVGGIGVGRGYLNDPEQTRRRFLSDPFSGRRGGRLYRTGDLARWRADGTLECLGRADQQVKIRGYRVELGEIEHALLEHPHVQAAVVLAGDDLRGARLIAHIVTAGRQANANELRDFLKTRVPAYMLPSGFIFLESMPLTANGKVDRRALRAVRQKLRVAEGKYIAPRNPIEEGLAAIWKRLLKVDNIGALSNFFDLGGHSLLAGQVLARIANDFGVALPIRTLFEAPTIEALARRVERAPASSAEPPAIAGRREGLQPVAIVQEEVLRIERALPGLPQFNLPFAFRLRGPLDVPALERSLAVLVRRHDALRTGFTWVDERPLARVVRTSALDTALVVDDLGCGAASGDDVKALVLKKAGLLAEQCAWTPFDTTRAPLLRTRLLRLGPDDHVLILTLHHSIVDGWSIDVLFEEVSKLYGALTVGRRARLPRPGVSFADLARQQRAWCNSDAAVQQLARWKERLRGASPIFAVVGGGAALASRICHEPVDLPGELVAELAALGRDRGASLFMALLAGFKAALLAGSGRGDLCVATAMANRAQHGTERIIGPLQNTTVIRTHMHLDLSFQEALDRVRDSVLEAHASQELPFDILASRLAEDGADPSALMQVFFVLQNAFRQRLELRHIEMHSFGDVYREGQPVLPIDRTWLTVMLKERPSGITGACSYKAALVEADAVRHWMADYQQILVNAAANPKTPLGRLIGR